MTPGITLCSYHYRLDRLNLFSLRHERMRGDLLEVYKMLNGMDELDVKKLFARSCNGGSGHSLKLLKNIFQIQVRPRFLANGDVDF